MTSIVAGKSRISLLESERYVAGTRQVYKIQVSFSDDWQSLEKKIIFKNDCFEIGVDVRNQSETFPIPSELFMEPSNKLQVGAYGYSNDQVVLETRWASLGRVEKGVIKPGCGCNPPIPTMPSPITYDYLNCLIDQKADRLTFEDGMFVLWSGDKPLSSFESPVSIPDGGETDQVLAKASNADGDVYWRTVKATSPATMLKVPLGTIQVWSGSIDEIPESYSLCDGQNGTPDLRYAMVVGASESIEPGTSIYGPGDSEPMPIGRSISQENRLRYYALAFIQKTSLTEADMKEGKSAYEIALENGFSGTEEEWLESLEGPSAYDVAVENGFIGTENEWLSSLRGTPGEPGAPGRDGKSAYENAVDAGYTGTEEEFGKALMAFPGVAVSSEIIAANVDIEEGAYIFKDVVLKQQTGKDITFRSDMMYVDKSDPKNMVLTSQDNTRYICALSDTGKIVSIQVKPIHDQIVDIAGEAGPGGSFGVVSFNGRAGAVTPQDGDYNAFMVGAVPDTRTVNGKRLNADITITKDDIDGLEDGKSAYRIAVDNGFEGTEQEWLESLKGDPGLPGDNGDSAYQSAVNHGFTGTEEEWLASLKGDDGRSAYQVAADDGFAGTETEWLASLKGEKGDPGVDGKSAYQVAAEDGFVGTETEWLASLKGDKGDKGSSAYDVAVANGYGGTEEEWLKSLQGKSVQMIQDYSTGETLVGRWIDNRPVYRRIVKTLVEQTDSVVTVTTIPGIELANAITGIIQVQNGSRWCSIPGTDQGTDYGLDYVSETGAIELYASYISEESKQIQLTLEYVKTGDDPLTDDQLVVNPGGSDATSDHRLLINRDAADQHPISSISMLSDQLNATPKEAITDEQVNALFN